MIFPYYNTYVEISSKEDWKKVLLILRAYGIYWRNELEYKPNNCLCIEKHGLSRSEDKNCWYIAKYQLKELDINLLFEL